MALIDLLTPETISELRQTGHAWLDRLGMILQDLGRANKIKITIEIEPKPKQ